MEKVPTTGVDGPSCAYLVTPGAIRAACDVTTPAFDGLVQTHTYVYLAAGKKPQRSPATKVAFDLLPAAVQDAVVKVFDDRFAMSGAEQDRRDWPTVKVVVEAPIESAFVESRKPRM